MWALGLITWSSKHAERVDVVIGSRVQWKHHPVLQLTRRREEVQRWSSHESGGMKLRHVESDVWLKVPPKGWREKSQLNSNYNPSANYQVKTCYGNGIPFPKDCWKKNFDVGFFVINHTADQILFWSILIHWLNEANSIQDHNLPDWSVLLIRGGAMIKKKKKLTFDWWLHV